MKFSKGITLIELILYVFFFALIGIYIAFLAVFMFNSIDFARRMQFFAMEYDRFIKTTIDFSQRWRVFSGAYDNKILFQNILEEPTLFREYRCFWTGITISYENTSSDLKFVGDEYTYPHIECEYMSGWVASWWYWIAWRVYLGDKPKYLKYYFFTRP